MANPFSDYKINQKLADDRKRRERYEATMKFCAGAAQPVIDFLRQEKIDLDMSNEDDRAFLNGLDLIARASLLATHPSAGKDKNVVDRDDDPDADETDETEDDKTDAQKLADKIVEAGRKRRGDDCEPPKKKGELPPISAPVGSLAYQIVLAGMRRRGEIE